MDCPCPAHGDGGVAWQQGSVGSGVGHWQGYIGVAASTLVGGHNGGDRTSTVGGRVSVVGVWSHGRG